MSAPPRPMHPSPYRAHDPRPAASDALRELLDETTELVCAADESGRITYANRAWLTTLGYVLDDAIGLRAVELVAPEDRERYLDAARRLHDGERITEFEAVLVGADGRRVICRGRATPELVDDAGAPGGRRCVGTRASYRDVTAERQAATARARAEDALRRSEAQLGAIVDHAAIGITVVAPDGTMLNANAAFHAFLGYADGALVGCYAPSLSPAEDGPITRDAVAALRAGHVPHATATKRFVRRDGTIRWGELTLTEVPLADGGTGILGIVVDVTERRAAEAALAASEARYRAAIEGSLDAFIALRSVRDAAGAIVDFEVVEASTRAADLVQMPREDLLGHHVCELFPITRTAGHFERFVAVVETRTTAEWEEEPTDPRIVARAMRVQAVPLDDGIALSLRDVTERWRAETALERERTFLASVLDGLSENVSVCDAHGRLTRFNRATREFHGLPPNSELPPEEWSAYYDVLLPDGTTPFPVEALPHVRARVEAGSVEGVEFVIAPRGRPRRTMVANAHVLRGPDGAFLGTVCVARDMTAERAAQAALRENEERLSLIYNAASDLMFLVAVERDAEGAAPTYRCTSVNAAYFEVTGLAEAQVVGRTVYEILPPDAAAFAVGRYELAICTGDVQRYLESVALPTGHVMLETTLTPVHDDAGVCTHLLGVARDVTARERAEAALRESESRFRGVLETVRTAAVTLDAQGTVTFANDALCELTGWSRDEIVGADWFARVVSNGEARRAAFAEMVARGDTPPHQESEIVTRDGMRRLVAWDVTAMRDATGAMVGVTSIGRDVTAQKASEEALRTQALVDDLTGLYNRRGFQGAAERQWRRAARDQCGALLAYIDLNDFKQINDAFGHAEGDRALVAVSDVLRATFRGADAIGRLGGDEFAVLVVPTPGGGEPVPPGLDAVERMVRERLSAQLAAANAAAHAAGRPYALSLSIGVAQAVPGAPDGGAADRGVDVAGRLASLVAEADARLYAEKRRRRETESAPR